MISVLIAGPFSGCDRLIVDHGTGWNQGGQVEDEQWFAVSFDHAVRSGCPAPVQGETGR